MAEDVARAVGASAPKGIMIGGKECLPRPLTIRELGEIERACLEYYKEKYLQTFSDSLKYLPRGDRTRVMLDKIEEAAKWDVKDLPTKWAHDARRIEVTDALKQKVINLFNLNGDPLSDQRVAMLAANALDQGLIEDKEYKEMADHDPPREKVPYVAWWCTGPIEGALEMVTKCFSRDGVTRDEVAEAFPVGRHEELMKTALSIEKLTAPAAEGNG